MNKKYRLVIECTDGIHTVANFYIDGKGIATAGTRKHPDDTFDFWTAVETVVPRVNAFAKLLAPPDPFKVWVKFKEIGRFVKFANEWYVIGGQTDNIIVNRFGNVYRVSVADINLNFDEIAEAKNFKSVLSGNRKTLWRREK